MLSRNCRSVLLGEAFRRARDASGIPQENLPFRAKMIGRTSANWEMATIRPLLTFYSVVVQYSA